MFRVLESPPFIQLLTVFLSLPDMTLLSSQSSSLSIHSGSVSTEKPEQRMLEKRAKVVAELLQTEKDYIRDLEMCIERVMVPLQQAQVGDRRQPDQPPAWLFPPEVLGLE